MPTLHANEIELHYEERGAGEPLLLLMGLGADGSLWAEHVKVYERHFRCFLLDNRGAGRSEKPPGPYSTAEMAEDVAAFARALGLGPAHVAGISMGGAIAQELAVRHPGLIKSLTLISTWDACDAYTARVFEMLRAAAAALDPAALQRLLQLWIFSPQHHEARMADLLAREAAGLRHPYPLPLHAFQAQCDACIAHRAQGRLAAIAAPTLVTAGDRDIFTPLHYAEAIAAQIRRAELHVFRGAGHAHHWEQVDDFNRITIEHMLKHNKLPERRDHA